MVPTTVPTITPASVPSSLPTSAPTSICSGEKLESNVYIQSGCSNCALFGPEKAFDDSEQTYWAGQHEDEVDKEFFIGLEFSISVEVLCISLLDSNSGKGTNLVRIQAYDEILQTYITMAEIDHSPGQRQDIVLFSPDTNPTSLETLNPVDSKKWRVWSQNSYVEE